MNKNRIEAFSDGVIAIVITLLVLEIKIPVVSIQNGEEALIRALLHSLPKFLAYFTSFIILAVWWVAHHQFFHSLHKADRNLLWLNNLFLMWLCLIPFVTGLIGDYPGSKTGALLYGAIATLTASSFLWMRWYSSRHPELLNPTIPSEAIKKALKRSLLSPLLHLLGTVCGIAIPYSAIIIFAAIAIFYIFPSPVDKHLSTNTTEV
jgi:uncharacterized membrane protein